MPGKGPVEGDCFWFSCILVEIWNELFIAAFPSVLDEFVRAWFFSHHTYACGRDFFRSHDECDPQLGGVLSNRTYDDEAPRERAID